jgi:hypothetical protein
MAPFPHPPGVIAVDIFFCSMLIQSRKIAINVTPFAVFFRLWVHMPERPDAKRSIWCGDEGPRWHPSNVLALAANSGDE